MNIKAAFAIVLVAATPVSAFAYNNIDMDHMVDGRSTQAVASILSEEGIDAQSIEEWGQSYRVEAIDEAGKLYVVIVDKDTLLPKATTAVR